MRHPEGHDLASMLRRLNARLASGLALELAAGSGEDDALVLLGVLRDGAVAVVPVAPGRSARSELLSLSRSIAECAMLLGLGTGIYRGSDGPARL